MDESRRCTAKSKQSGERCKRAAVVGATVCSMHGGKIPRVVAAAARRRAAATYGLPVDVNPLDALLEELRRTAGHVAWLGSVVADLDEVMEATMFGLSPSAWVKLYQHERTHLARVARDCLSAGVEERQVRIAEEQGRLVSDLIRRIITGIGMDPNAPAVREVVHRELTLLAGRAA
jgi:hypothetical protein